jgi:penicillin-binding protein 2
MSISPKLSAKTLISILILLGFLFACNPNSPGTTNPAPTSAESNLLEAVSAQATAKKFLDAWKDEDFAAMYQLLTIVSKDALSFEQFSEKYQDAAQALTLESVEYNLLNSMAGDHFAEVYYNLHYKTRLMGELNRQVIMSLERESQDWRVQWDDGLILPELHGGNVLEFVHEIPSRGRIFDRNGAPLASYENAIAIGLVPGEILAEQADTIFETLAEISLYDKAGLADLVDSTPDDWYLPIVSLPQADAEPYVTALQGLSGVRLDSFSSRFYVDGGVAPHAVGYLLYIPEEQMDAYLRLGYRQDERIGAAGLEAVLEAELSGIRGGGVYVKSPLGGIQTLLASSESQPGQSVYTTLDKDLESKLQASLGDLRGAVIVMEADTGRVLALVSNPGFNPNAFDLSEADRGLLESYFSDEDQPLFNRATQGQYPLGSVFKTISVATALETGLYSLYSTIYCGHSMWVCDRMTLYDWTYDYGVAASGTLTIQEGLMRSCNPWFYSIGQNLFEEDMPDALPSMAYGFGLGVETGIEIPEASGNIPLTADTCMNGAQIAIGQGEVLVTPIQVVTFFAALANGGTLYRPTLVERIETTSGKITYVFVPESKSELPISEETLAAVQEGLRMVVEDPRGTGTYAMAGLEIPVSGKTGTAQTPTGDSHAWFAGYTRQNDPEHPDIAIVVLIENAGEGSVMAAPVFRRAVSLYFSNGLDPAGLMPWESEPYLPLEPTQTTDSTSGD